MHLEAGLAAWRAYCTLDELADGAIDRDRAAASRSPLATEQETSPMRVLRQGARRSGIGATSPLPCVPAKVPSTSDLQTFAIVR